MRTQQSNKSLVKRWFFLGMILSIGVLVLSIQLQFAAALPAATNNNAAPFNLQNAATSTTTFNIWDGITQTFGHNGEPQVWVNVLGNVTDNVGIKPESECGLFFRLNGNIVGENNGCLEMGGDEQRLLDPGDFNIDIAYSDLQPGSNTIVMTATNTLNQKSTQTITVNYDDGNTWPLPYAVDWSSETAVSDAAQVVDGKWVLEADSLRTNQVGYDRLVAIGDMTSWTNYEVTVPVTVHSAEAYPYATVGGSPGVGIMLRWQGHNYDRDRQPALGWDDHGSLAWFRWLYNASNTGRAELAGNVETPLQNNSQNLFIIGNTFYMKARVLTVAGGDIYYSYKMWNASDSEPFAWDMVALGDANSTDNGSILLVAHKVDVSFGDVIIQPVSDSMHSLNITAGTGGQVTLAPPPNLYPSGYPYGTQVTVTATPNSGWNFSGWNGDLDGSPAQFNFIVTKDVTASALFTQDQSGISSDIFNVCQLNENKWTFIDPLGDSTLIMNGLQANITVPAGVSHNLWTNSNHAPRIMQPVSNPSADFQIVIKYESDVNVVGTMQGIIVEQDSNNLLRIDAEHKTGNMRLYAARMTNGNFATIDSETVSGPVDSPIFLRLTRIGNQWVLDYSLNETTWMSALDINQTLNVTAVGVFAGNFDTNPTYTSKIDYFMNSAIPLNDVGEVAPTVNLVTNTFGNGTVTTNPPAVSTFNCGAYVTLTAYPANYWMFNGWTGAEISNQNPFTILMDENKVINANFKELERKIFIPFLIK
jgi:hypothetical protein